MGFEIVIWILIGLGIFFALPSTIYTAMFFGVFHRRKTLMLEKDDLKNTQYFPYADKLRTDILYAKGLPCELIRLKAQDGVALTGRYYANGSNKVIVFVHGYQSNAFNNFSTALKDFLEKGYGVLLIDQRAHGESGGKFTTFGNREKEDLLLWIDYLDKRAEIKKIAVYGISMGATTVGFASEHIKTEKVKALIMEAGFTCVYEHIVRSVKLLFMKQAALNYIYLTAKIFLKVDIKNSNESALKNNKIPVLFLHGDTDKEVDIEFTQTAYAVCGAEKKAVTVKGAGHTLCYLAGGEFIRNEIDEFLDKYINNYKGESYVL